MTESTDKEPGLEPSDTGPGWAQHRDDAGHGYGHTTRLSCGDWCATYPHTTCHDRPPPLSWEGEDPDE